MFHRHTGILRRLSSERGQTTTEYLMISGIMVSVAIIVLGYMQEPFRQRLQDIVEYMIDVVADPKW